MDAKFWQQRWANNEIAFHDKEAANSLLSAHFAALSLPQDARVFVPLCGKTLDIAWLLGQGFQVAGAELSLLAIEQLFEELGVQPRITQQGKLVLYQADSLDIWVGDIFDLSSATLGQVDAIYDRAALVALPKEMRARYTSHLVQLTGARPQLLICYTYDQSQVPGPPFSVDDDEVSEHYAANYGLIRLSSNELSLRGQVPAQETAWLLKKCG